VARLSKEQWEALRVDYEVKGMTLSELSSKYGADRGNISKRSKKYNWQREKVQQIIGDKISAAKALGDIAERTTTLDSNVVIAIEKEVDRRMRLEGLFTDSIEYNQNLANQILKAKDASAELQDLNIHSQITNRNKDGIMGKMPQTQVNIQNNVSTDADSVVKRLKEKHQ